MSNLSRFTSKFRAHSNGLQESAGSRVTKRPRESLVCNPCRTSKLRCDRGQPCSSCLKRDDSTACNYRRSPASKVGVGRHAAAEDKLIHLESLVKQLMQIQASPQSGNGLTPLKSLAPREAPKDAAAVLDQPRNMQAGDTKYVGSTHWSAILDDIDQLKVVIDSSADAQEPNESIALDHPAVDSDPIFGFPNEYSLEQLISQSLPSKVEVDRFLSIYFRGETFIIPFVHTYHFQSQYRDFWADPTSVNPLWLSILFSICYMASMIGAATASYPSSETGLVTGRSILHAAAAQCLVLGEYHRPQRFGPEALAMYAQCKNLQTLDPSREAGAILGMVIRMAYEMGYHRDPDSFGSFTVFEGEMRRRFWAVCKQMDLMISFQLGLPSHVCLENCDTRSPRNLLDSDFGADSRVLPPSRSQNEATSLLWFIIKDKQMISFSKVCRDALSFKERSEADILQLDQEIRQMQTTTPNVLRTRPISESIVDAPLLIMTRLYIDFIYLKSLCVLHRRFMARGNKFSTESCVEAGKRLVGQFIDMYKEFAPGGQLYAERWMLTNFTMNDFLLGVMVLCLVVHTQWKRSSSAIDAATESEVLALLEQSHAICIEKATASRDARRVAHAIRLTLKGTKEFLPATSLAAASSNIERSTISNDVHQQPFNSEDPVSSQPWYGYDAQGEEAAFGLLDPFNFVSNHIVENIDWTMFDAQLPGQEDSNFQDLM